MPKVSDKIKEYVCNHCPKSYVHQSGLCNHIKSAHHDIYLLKKKQKILQKTLTSKITGKELELKKSLSDRDYLTDYILRSEVPFNCDIVLVISSLLQGQITVQDGQVSFLQDGIQVQEPISDEICHDIVLEYVDCIMDILYKRIKNKDKESLTMFNYMVERYQNADIKIVSNMLRSNIEKTFGIKNTV